MCIECKKCGKERDFEFRNGEYNEKVSHLKGGEEYVTHGWKVLKKFGDMAFKDSFAWICPSCRAGAPLRGEREQGAILALSEGKCPVHRNMKLTIQEDMGLCPFCFDIYLIPMEVGG